MELVSGSPNRSASTDQFDPGSRVGHYAHRPRWRSNASGAGEPLRNAEPYQFARAALDLALAFPHHDETMLCDLIPTLHSFREVDQDKVWNLIDTWTAKEQDEARRAVVREHIRRYAFTRRSKHLRLSNHAKDRARQAHDRLIPKDVVIRHRWLFAAQWLQESVAELEDDNLDYEKREEAVRKARVEALREIWSETGFEGILALAATNGTPVTIGWHLADGVIDEAGSPEFLTRCLAVRRPRDGFQDRRTRCRLSPKDGA